MQYCAFCLVCFRRGGWRPQYFCASQTITSFSTRSAINIATVVYRVYPKPSPSSLTHSPTLDFTQSLLGVSTFPTNALISAMTVMQFNLFPKPAHAAKPWRFEGHHTDALHKQLHNRERMHTHKRRRPSTSAWTAACTPEILRPTELTLEEYDKVFASIWISHDEVVLGTKCNRLIILNVQTNRRCNIPLVSLPDTLGSSTGAATGMTTKGSLGPNSASALGRSQDDANLGSNCSGIRSLAVNPSRTLLAVGAGNPIQIMVYSLPSFEPYAIFRGHVDCAFAVDWLDDTRLVSGSRDGTLRVWDVTENVVAQHPVLLNATVQVNTSIITRSEIKGRIRDVKLDRTRDEFVTLSTEGYVKLWDTSRVEGMYTCGLRHMQEAVCMARNERAGIYAVGSQGHVSFIDPRAGVRGIVHEVASVDDGWGVRSLSFDNHMVTAGGGLGRVSFYDLRAQQYLMVDAKSGANYIQASGGWLCQDANYQTYFVGQPIQNAIYTLTYDDDRTRLFAAGGPLQAGLTGSYAALMCRGFKRICGLSIINCSCLDLSDIKMR
ncbi:WD40-repeat-containing domain protein [Jimgerdemannia flammicorona]|uniref:WD40-repeat-containing domain protein n=1 Tax=Jimgerdemannia flammicorona TaxID=994334 RepID=A0A433Q7G4_9FUNG|nr:WD40-repeat-containing domain protein [Jimgerdemannia flammicorona]